ncbi:hypothetical protein F2P81_016220 [Scophthalmus maximus]|uniref:Uncharacterized protein n=1 Tax=Scophthalmus maximus TaxID=52904 RepID=A0A6A4SGB9_SCOMX|nr:hypothetical protein F2P81_016220 [Scophthalmus maximus]
MKADRNKTPAISRILLAAFTAAGNNRCLRLRFESSCKLVVTISSAAAVGILYVTALQRFPQNVQLKLQQSSDLTNHNGATESSQRRAKNDNLNSDVFVQL